MVSGIEKREDEGGDVGVYNGAPSYFHPVTTDNVYVYIMPPTPCVYLYMVCDRLQQTAR